MAQPAEFEQVSYNAPDGAQFGKTITDKISFYGSTPIVQPTISTNISTAVSVSNAPYGFTTSSEALNIQVGVSTIAAALRALGLVV